MSRERLDLAQELLREAVFRAREAQALRGAISPASRCGLGEGPEPALDLTGRGHELAARLHPGGLAGARQEEVRAALAAWVQRQDVLDRKRNHFLKDFRARHGFDRTRYAPETLAAFEEGLARINAEEDAARRAAAAGLL